MYRRQRPVTCSTSLPLDWNLAGTWSNSFTGCTSFRMSIFGQVQVERNGFGFLARLPAYYSSLDATIVHFSRIGDFTLWLFLHRSFGGMDFFGC